MIDELIRRFLYARLVKAAQVISGHRPHYKVQYGNYLQGPRWFLLRNSRLWFDGWQCTRCGDRYPLHVHHTSYRHKGAGVGINEFLDLRTLCASCHRKEHRVGQSNITQKQTRLDTSNRDSP